MSTLIGGGIAVAIVLVLMVVIAVAFGAWILIAKRKKNPSAPVTTVIAPGTVQKIIDTALTGNVAAVKDALLQEIEFEWGNGGKDLLLDYLKESVQNRLNNPKANAWLLDAAAKLTLKTPQQIIDAVVTEFGLTANHAPAPAPTAAAAAATATALLLCCCSIAGAAHPAAYAGPSHWHADVRAPQSFLPTQQNLFAEMRDCDLPDPGPSIYVYYFHADWCTDCGDSTRLADSLKQQKYNVIKINAATQSGAQTAKAFRIKSVPYWIIFEDGREVVDSNDSRKVVNYLSDHKPSTSNVSLQRGVIVRAPDGSVDYGQRQIYYTVSPQQQMSWWQAGPARRFVSAPFRRLFRRRC